MIDEKEKLRLKNLIVELKKYRGRHTELVSVYIPKGYDLNKIINHLEQEKGTATNIKSSATRKNVIDALERMLQHLKLFLKTPDNGLAVFSGNVAEREGQSDIEVWSIEPPLPLQIRIYRCDKEFVLEPLEGMLESREIYGLVVMDRRDAIIALLKGKTIVPLVKKKSNVPGKSKAGGQSAQRFERIREVAAKEFFSRIGEVMKEQFLGKKEIKGILMGGPGPTKYDFVDGNFITTEVKRKIIAIKDLSYTGEFGLEELVDRSQDVLEGEALVKEKRIMQRFLELLATRPNMVGYGKKEVERLLKMGVVDTLLISEELDENERSEMQNTAETLGTKVEIISTETREGVQLKNLGKVAAILRYEMST